MTKKIRDYAASDFKETVSFKTTLQQKERVLEVAKAQGTFLATIYRRYIDEGLERDLGS